MLRLALLVLSAHTLTNAATVDLSIPYRNGWETRYPQLLNEGSQNATQYLEKEFEKHPDDKQLKTALYGEHKLAKEHAATYIESDLKAHPDKDQLHYLLGIHYLSEKTDEAIAHFKTIARNNPRYADSHFLLGMIAFSDHDLSSFANHMQSVMLANPFYVQAYNSLAMVYAKTNKLDQAIQVMEDANGHMPKEESFYFNQALMYLAKGQYQEVVRDIKSVTALGTDRESLFMLGWSYFKLKDYEATRLTMRKILDDDPKNINALLLIATTHKEAKDFDKALAVAEQARTIDPANKTVEQEIKEYQEEYRAWKERNKR